MALSNVLPYLIDQADKDRVGAMVFEEDFNIFQLDRDVWDSGYATTDFSQRNYEVVTYHDESIERTVLRIWPQYDKSLDVSATDTLNGFFRREISTGNLGFRQKYGYFEICAKLNRNKGLWPQFLLTNPNGQEIRLMETFTAAPYADAELNPINFRANTSGTSHDTTLTTLYGGTTRRLDTGFHTYGCEWTPDYVKFFFDGKFIGIHWHGGAVNALMMLAIRLWYGSDAGDPNTTDTLQGVFNAMEIDHVRTWLLKDFGTTIGYAAGSGRGTLGLEVPEQVDSFSVGPFISTDKYSSVNSD